MEPGEIKGFLKEMHIPLIAVTIVVIVAGFFYVYRQYQDTYIAKLTIDQMKRDLEKS